MGTKVCCRCKIEKDRSEFYVNKKGRVKDGLQSRCKACAKESAIKWKKEHPERGKQLDKEYHERNKARRNEQCRVYDATHQEERRVARRKWEKKNKTNIQFQLRRRLRYRLRDALGSKKNRRSSLTWLGCSIDEFVCHIESLFTEGMTWQLLFDGFVELDHVIPLSWFDLTDPEQLKAAAHWSNIQPMWAWENRAKGNRYAS